MMRTSRALNPATLALIIAASPVARAADGPPAAPTPPATTTTTTPSASAPPQQQQEQQQAQAREQSQQQNQEAQAAAEEWAPVTSGPMASLTAPLTPPWQLTLQPIVLGVLKSGAFDANGVHTSAPATAELVSQLFVEAGLADWVAVGAQPQLRALPDVALADTLVFTRFAWRPVGAPRDAHPFATTTLMLTLPTGDVDAGAGDGSFVATAGVSFTVYVEPVVVHVDALGSAPLPDGAGKLTLRPQAVWTLAVEWPLPWIDNRVALLAEVAGRHQPSTDDDADTFPDAGPAEQEIVFGVGVELIASDTLQALVGYQRVLFGQNIEAFDAVVVTVVPLLF